MGHYRLTAMYLLNNNTVTVMVINKCCLTKQISMGSSVYEIHKLHCTLETRAINLRASVADDVLTTIIIVFPLNIFLQVQVCRGE